MSTPVHSDGITVYVYARTDVGMRRQGNEDSFLVADLSTGRLGLTPEVAAHQLGNNGSLMVVSDGLGGAAAGEVASAMAVQTVCTELMKSAKSILSPSDRLKRATESANEQIWTCAQSDVSLRGMGATLTASFVHGGTVYIAQIGDSRAYMIRGNQVKQVTEDQSWANAVKKAGLETKDVPGNVILQALGTQPKVHVEVTSVDLRNGDSMLLCSDGLSNKVTDVEMREIVRDSLDLPDACRQLVELANKRGGEDNVTVIIAQFTGEKLPSSGVENTSITSTFKVVQPLDFNEEGDGTDTMSFRPEGEGSALSDQLPTLSDLPQLPELPEFTVKGASRETSRLNENAPTSPLTGQALPKTSAIESQKKPTPKPDIKATSKLEGTLFSPPPKPETKSKPPTDEVKKGPAKTSPFADTKPDLPLVPIPDAKPGAERKNEPKTGKLPDPGLKFDLELDSLPELNSPPPPVQSAKPSKPAQEPPQSVPPPQSSVPPPLPPPLSPTLFTSNPGLFFTPAEVPNPPSKPEQYDDDIDPLMFETLTILPEESGKKTGPLTPKAAATTGPALTAPPPAVPPRPAAPPAEMQSFPKLETLQPQTNDLSKSKLSGPEVLASLFSAPPAKTEPLPETPKMETPKMELPKLEPPRLEPKLELPKLEPPRLEPKLESKTESLKPAVPPLVMPKGAEPKPSAPPTGSLPPSGPTKGTEPLPGRLYFEDIKAPEPPPMPPPRLSLPTGGLPSKPGMPPRPDSLPSSIFSPPSAGSPTRPLPGADSPLTKQPIPPLKTESPSTSPLKSNVPPLQPPRSEPPRTGPLKTDFPTPSGPLPPLQQSPPVRTSPPVQAPPIRQTGETGALKQTSGSFPASGTKSVPPPVRAAASSKEFGSSISSQPRKISPKLLMGGGGAIVVVIALIIGFSYFFGGDDSAQPGPTENPPATQTQPVEPQQTEPTVQNPPDKPVEPPPQTTPAPTETVPENVPTDTAGLVKHSLDEVKKTIERVKKDLPESDPRKEGFLQRLNAFERELNGYAATGRADEEARGYAESARSQFKSIRRQLDQLPAPAPKGKK